MIRNHDASMSLLNELDDAYPHNEFGLITKQGTAYEDNPDVPDQVIAFTHEDTVIIDPLMSECGRFSVDAKYYGLNPFDVLRIANHNGTWSDQK